MADRDEETERYLSGLWRKAFVKNSFNALCTLLRVDGIQEAGWDRFEESIEAFEDFEWLFETSNHVYCA